MKYTTIWCCCVFAMLVVATTMAAPLPEQQQKADKPLFHRMSSFFSKQMRRFSRPQRDEDFGDGNDDSDNNGPDRCPDNKVLICHHPPGNEDEPFAICVSWDSYRTHIRKHKNDTRGPCPTDPEPPATCPAPCDDVCPAACGNQSLSLGDLADVTLVDSDGKKRGPGLKPGESLVSDGNNMFVLESYKVTICHKPEGPSPQTLVISAHALQAHLDHGDIEGVCPDCFCSLDELEDVAITNVTDCHVIHFTEDGGWENKNIREIVNNTLADLDDTTIVNPEDCNVIHFQDGTWENKDIREIVNNTLVDLDDTCTENPQAGDHLVYNGSCYINSNECPAACDDVCPSACGNLTGGVNCSCPPGPAGQDGIDGVDGINGTNGLPGLPGADGVMGIPGNDGVDGINGTNGINGVNGIDGVDGINGTNGLPGLPGADGDMGISGSDGVDGINGTNGIDGIDGVDGVCPTTCGNLTSSTNCTCPPGADGQDGINGTNGSDGLPGADGSDGATGVPGINGTNGSDGIDGVQGPRGFNGTDAQDGADGATGPAGNCTCPAITTFSSLLGAALGQVVMSATTPRCVLPQTPSGGSCDVLPASALAPLPGGLMLRRSFATVAGAWTCEWECSAAIGCPLAASWIPFATVHCH